MKKTVGAVVVLVIVLFGAMKYISGNGEEYFKEYIKAMNKAQKGAIVFRLKEYRNSFFSAEADVEMDLPGLISRKNRFSWLKLPVINKMKIHYGPVIVNGGAGVGLMHIEAENSISRLLKPEAKKKFSSVFTKDIIIRYSAVMDFSKNMHEEIDVTEIHSIDKKKGNAFLLKPVKIKTVYALEHMTGHGELRSNEMRIEELRKNKQLIVKKPELKANISERTQKNLIFGIYSASAEKIEVRQPRNKISPLLRFSGDLSIGLKRTSRSNAEASLHLFGRTLDADSRKIWKGIKEILVDIKIRNAGVDGLEEMVEYQQDRMHC